MGQGISTALILYFFPLAYKMGAEFSLVFCKLELQNPSLENVGVKTDIVGWESKLRNSDFYQNDFLSTRENQMHGAHSVKFS